MIADHLNEAIYDLSHSPIREFSNLAKNTEGCIALTLGEPDFDTPENITAKVGTAFQNHETHYIPNNGMPELLKEIETFENTQNGMHYKAGQIITTAGATEGLFLSLFSILNPEDEVIVPTPAFLLYEQIIKVCRGKFIPLDTSKNHFQIDEEELKKCITTHTKAIILNTPNNPTGCILNEISLRTVYNCVKGKDIFIICDDVYRQLSYEGKAHSFTEYEDLAAQTILVQSFSKPYAMTGWRMGYMVVPEEIKPRIELVHQYMITSTPAPFQRACIEALHTDPELFLIQYRKRRTMVLQEFDRLKLLYVRPEGAFYVFPDISKYRLSSLDFCTRMINEVKLAATPGFCFGDDACIRFSYCCSEETIQEGMKRLAQFLAILKKEGRG